MGQYEILAYLEQNRGWHLSKTIAKHFGITPSVAGLSLRRLCKWGLAEVSYRGKNRYYYRATKGLNSPSTQE